MKNDLRLKFGNLTRNERYRRRLNAEDPNAIADMQDIADYTETVHFFDNWASGTTYDDGLYSTALKEDGTQMYVCSNLTNDFKIFDLATPYDLDSYTYTGFKGTRSPVPNGFWMDTTHGLNFGVSEVSSSSMTTYSITDPFEPTDANKTLIEIWNAPVDTQAWHMTGDGTRMFTYEKAAGATISHYLLSTPWTPSTGVLQNTFEATVTNGARIWVGEDGISMITTNINTSTIHHYRMATPWDVSTATQVSTMASPTGTTAAHIWVSSNGKYLLIGKQNLVNNQDYWLLTYPGSGVTPF